MKQRSRFQFVGSGTLHKMVCSWAKAQITTIDFCCVFVWKSSIPHAAYLFQQYCFFRLENVQNHIWVSNVALAMSQHINFQRAPRRRSHSAFNSNNQPKLFPAQFVQGRGKWSTNLPPPHFFLQHVPQPARLSHQIMSSGLGHPMSQTAQSDGHRTDCVWHLGKVSVHVFAIQNHSCLLTRDEQNVASRSQSRSNQQEDLVLPASTVQSETANWISVINKRRNLASVEVEAKAGPLILPRWCPFKRDSENCPKENTCYICTKKYNSLPLNLQTTEK